MADNMEAIWDALGDKAASIGQTHLRDIFAENPERFEEFSFKFDSLLLDLSKQRYDTETLSLLLEMAKQSGLSNRIEAMFSGAHVNESEDRPALHTAMRIPANGSLMVDGVDVVPEIQKNFDRMEIIVRRLHNGQWRGYSGLPITNVINIGVGGSDLGGVMACDALRENRSQDNGSYHHIEVDFVSSMDGSQLSLLLEKLDPARTLFIISSKSFSTIDTLSNAATAREWLVKASGVSESIIMRRHFVGISCHREKMAQWGIAPNSQLLLWDWIGGRYSMWSAIGLPIAILIGMDGFRELLAGAHSMDRHYRETPFEENLPILLALTTIWNINFLDIHAQAILPYDGRLGHLPAYLEQLAMESNGKGVNREGDTVDYHTCPIIWGEIGTNAQHAFYQLLHQGTESVMCDFVMTARRYKESQEELRHQHTLSLSNCLAQSMILALGDSALSKEVTEDQPNWKRYLGNQPSSTLVLDELTPYSFGQLIALYEHHVYTQAVIWNINPFDQWGVELGKTAATMLLEGLESRTEAKFDLSTEGLIDHIHTKLEGES